MTTLPFTDQPQKLTSFDAFWVLARRKVAKAAARKAFAKALKRADETMLFNAWRDANARWRVLEEKFIPYPASWLNGDRWEDEHDIRDWVNHVKKTPEQLQIVAAHAKQPWCQIGAITREALQECVDAGLLTVERMEEVS